LDTLQLSPSLPRQSLATETTSRSEQGERLARRVEQGLNRMIKDGSFDALFKKYKGP
jgi:hypothetical protein